MIKEPSYLTRRSLLLSKWLERTSQYDAYTKQLLQDYDTNY